MITNKGNEWLTDVSLIGQNNCSYYLLAPGRAVTCHLRVQLTQHDLDSFDAEQTLKQVTAHVEGYALSNTSRMLEHQDAASVPLVTYSGLSLSMTAAPAVVATAGKLWHQEIDRSPQQQPYGQTGPAAG